MCGIAGITGQNISNKLYKLLIAMKHRGPDNSGAFVDNKVVYGNLENLEIPEGSFGLGHNLLSIVGCEGSQPICHDNFVLVCNGEIYNFKKLKSKLNHDFKTDSDCEVIIGLVKQFYDGKLYDAIIKAIEYLDGDYTFAIYDGKDFAVLRDTVGVKPLYFGKHSNGKMFAFASERKSLWNIGIKDVKTLHPNYMIYNDELLKINDRLERYLKIKTLKNSKLKNNLSKGVLKKRLKKALIESVKKRITGLEKVAVTFSGGIDSTLLAKISDDLGVETILYTVGHKDSIDLKFAKKAASSIGLPLHIKTIDVEDVRKYLPLVLNAIEEFNVMKIGVGMPTYIASQIAHNDGLKVMLSGQGADELFGGYHRYLKFYHEKGENTKEDLKEDVLNLYHVNLQRDDAVTMANSVELRVPYLDLDVINIAMNIPIKYKINNEKDNLRKCILREVAAELDVPHEIVVRPKKAAQYGSGIHKILVKKVLKEENYKEALIRNLICNNIQI